MNDKLKEIVGFVCCLIVLLGIAYFTGFIKGFGISDFKNAYNQAADRILGEANSSKVKKYLSTNSDQTRTGVMYNNYHTYPIPKNVLEGYRYSNSFSNIFRSQKKVIFYIYDKQSQGFHNSIQNYVSKNKLEKNYNFVVYTSDTFRRAGTSSGGPAKICNSLEECNTQRQKAAGYTELVSFLENCGKSMCVISPQKQQYVILKAGNLSDAQRMIQGLKNW